jgi:hypothetical protein
MNLRTTSTRFLDVSEVENRLFWIYKCSRIREPLVIIIIIVINISESKLFENPQRTGSFHEITGQEPIGLSWKFHVCQVFFENCHYGMELVFFL